MKGFLKDPLFHFLLIGAGLFALFWLVNPQARDTREDVRTVVVDRPTVLKFLQFKMKAFEPKTAGKKFDALSREKRQKLIDSYIREEVLYREAKSFGLDKNDDIIRQRLVQKLDFMTRGFAEAGEKIGDVEAKAFYEANREDYRIPGNITFTHVFFSNRRHGVEEALKMARAAVADLNEAKVPFSKAANFGDKFPYNLNYVERPESSVAGHFGKRGAAEIFETPPGENTWTGPIQTEFGSHAILVLNKNDSRVLPYSEVRNRVKARLEQKKVREKTDAAVAEILKGYTIKISPDLERAQ